MRVSGSGYAVELSKLSSQESLQSLCALFTSVFGAPISPAAWKWKYHDPAIAGFLNVQLRRDGELLGHAGAQLLPGWIDGEPVPFAQVCDVMLSAQARGVPGPGGAYARLMNGLVEALKASAGNGMHFGFPGLRPFALGERLGFYRGTGIVHEHSVPTRRALARYWKLVELDWGDARLDRIWRSIAGRPGCWVQRDRAYLNWRYARNPSYRYVLLGVRRGLTLSGWVVLRARGTQVVVIDHTLADEELPAALGTIMGWARDRGFQALNWWDGSQDVPAWAGSSTCSTGIMGVVMRSSASRFESAAPVWQPGWTDVY